jgi:glycyl-tRNA synthetase beta chain
VAAFRELPEAESLAAANKRVHNILKKTEEAIPGAVDAGRLVESAERELADQVAAQREAVRPLLDNGDYTEALRRLAGLRAAVDAFFDQVLVMAEDPAVRANRLALLSGLRGLFLEVADISRLQS